MNQIQEYWENIDASVKRYVFIGTGAFILIVIVWAFVAGGKQIDLTEMNHNKEDMKKHITLFSGTGVKTLSLDRMQARLNQMKRDMDTAKREITGLKKELVQKQVISPPVHTGNELTASEVKSIVSKALQEKAQQEAEQKKNQVFTKNEQKPESEKKPMQAKQKLVSNADGGSHMDGGSGVTTLPGDVVGNPFRHDQPVMIDEKNGKGNKGGSTLPVESNIRTIEDSEGDVSSSSEDTTPSKYLPMGSIITGVFLNGLDAGTGKGAQKNPMPVLVRVKKEAILPNRFYADVRECFILASGYGELSSERVYLRAEGISCVNNDGGVIEVNANLYAVGEDGKAGVRGRLVNKQGALLAKSLAAGILSGFSSVFNQQAVPTIATTATGVAPFQKVLSQQSLQSGLVKGASSALDRLAQFYIDAADQIFPVLEVDAERRVTFIATKGFDMSVRKKTKKVKQEIKQLGSQ